MDLARFCENVGMSIWLEFLDKSGSEGLGRTHLHDQRWMQYEGPIPAQGDLIVADFGQSFRVVQRVFYFMPDPLLKVSLHCEKLS